MIGQDIPNSITRNEIYMQSNAKSCVWVGFVTMAVATVVVALVATTLGYVPWSKQDVARTEYVAPTESTTTTSSSSSETESRGPMMKNALPDPEETAVPVSLKVQRGSRSIIEPQSFGKATSFLPDGGWSPVPRRLEWYQKDYPKPGVNSDLRAVIAGHVVYNGRDDVFARLADVKAGDEVVITFSSGKRYIFVVYGQPLVANKEQLRTNQAIWGSNPVSQTIVLMTCDDQNGYESDGVHRKDNRVVWAKLQKIE